MTATSTCGDHPPGFWQQPLNHLIFASGWRLTYYSLVHPTMEGPMSHLHTSFKRVGPPVFSPTLDRYHAVFEGDGKRYVGYRMMDDEEYVIAPEPVEMLQGPQEAFYSDCRSISG